MEFTAQQIAELINGRVDGDASIVVDNLSKIEEGKPKTLSFLANPIYTQFIYTTNASIVIVNDDFIPDDSALAGIVNNELVVITGCSHSGICNIIEYAKKVTGISKVKTVIGVFHLKQNNLQTQKTIEFFKQNEVAKIYPSHCTELPALSAFYNEFRIQQIKTGMILEL